jgi:chlorobactene glucosyltransferase
MAILSLIVLVFWSLTLLRTIVNLLLVPRLARDPAPRAISVSVVIPARDEERAIARTVRAMLAQTQRDLEVIVVDDRSVDGTSAILAQLRAEDPRLVVVRGDEPPEG